MNDDVVVKFDWIEVVLSEYIVCICLLIYCGYFDY